MSHTFTLPSAGLVACGLIALLTSCGRRESARETASVDTTRPAAAAAGRSEKVPLTTASNEAQALYLKGRALSEQLRQKDARQFLEQAVAKDPAFAMAHYQLALASPTTKDFLSHLNQAVALSGKATEGERLTILGLQAGANANPKKSREYAEELVAKYPGDERAHVTLGLAYLGQQDYDKAIGEFKKATEINPSYSPAYNLLGYAYRPVGNNVEAENAFKKYIELVPNDPNPYDSYAELLMKTGRFDESIAQYRKALSIDPHFASSHFGIASDLMFQGKPAQAHAEAQKQADAARDDADRRLAMVANTVVYLDEGKPALALREMEKQYALGARIGDTAAMAGDAISMGDILLQTGRPDEARKRYQQALDLVQRSGLAADAKADASLVSHYNLARVALRKKDLATAKAEADEFRKGAEARDNDARVRQAHLLNGMIAIEEKDFDRAVSELKDADQQDPYVLYATALAYQGKGDATKVQEFARRAATMYTLPTLSYAFVRTAANRLATQ
ncbi:MAG: tetratricopeptide repeat protein [Gemmatimonadales bacterium]